MKNRSKNTHRGRGALENPVGRFERIAYEPDEEAPEEERAAPTTEFFVDTSKSIIAYNSSPDIGFDASLNVYRGCEHGCVYCYARPTHEYLGFSAGIDFESKIMVKYDAPELLRRELNARKWKPQTLAMSGVTDCYQPIERQLQLTRRCLQVLAEFRNPVGIVTKNYLVTRDIDALSELADYQAASVAISITTLDPALARIMEPRASHPQRRLAAIRELRAAGVPVGVMAAPVIPGLTDHELPTIIEEAVQAGAQFAGYVILRLPHGVSDVFQTWIERHFPDRAQKSLNRIREMREGKLNNPEFFDRMRGRGPYAEQIGRLFKMACRKGGIDGARFKLSSAAFRKVGDGSQIGLF